MSTVVVACKTIEREVCAAMDNVGVDFPVIWLESGLHNWPNKLRDKLQHALNQCGDADTVLLAMSLCGNSVVGIETAGYRLIIPKCDDCITLLLGSFEQRQSNPATYFLTKGWLDGERSVWDEYLHCVKRYGKEEAEEIMADMLGHYRFLAFVDSGMGDGNETGARVAEIASELKLEYARLDGTVSYLEDLFRGNWSDINRFLTVEPFEVISTQMCL